MELDLTEIDVSRVQHDWWEELLPDDTCVTSTGRSALAMILERLKRADPAIRSFLLPAYLCQSVVTPFVEAGISIRWYDVDRRLQPVPASLEGVAAAADVQGLLFINYFGLPISREAREAVERLKPRMWVIEDCAAGGLLEDGGETFGSSGHFSFTSLRKCLPMPDGAVIWNRSGLDLASGHADHDPEWVRLRLLGKLLRGEFLRLPPDHPSAPMLEAAYLDLFATSERTLDETGGTRGWSRMGQAIPSGDFKALRCRRQENYRTAERLFDAGAGALHPLRPLFAALPSSASPLVFPFLCRDEIQRDALRACLGQQRIFCPVHWPLPRQIDLNAHPDAALVSRSILAVPVDARYGEDDMRRVLGAVTTFVRGSRA
jgi:dTDP-4-amino-4,6-dideoxygalactose transaminase